MQIKNIYTTTSLFPGMSDTGMSTFSDWGRNAHNICLLGVSIDPVLEGGNEERACLFLFCDTNTDRVYEYRVNFPYVFLYIIDVAYDYRHSQWIVTVLVNARSHSGEPLKTFLDIHAFSGVDFQQRKRLLRIENDELAIEAGNYGTKAFPPKVVLSFSPSEDTFPWLCGYFSDDLAQPTMFVMQWEADEADQPVEWVELDDGFEPITYAFENSFLLFTCEYTAGTTYVERTEYSGLTGTWRLKVAAYEPNGSPITQQYVPEVSFLGHHEDLFAIDDLRRWIWPIQCVTQGPRKLEDGHETCVAALQLSEAVHYEKTLPPDEIQKTRQGGLYCFDETGHILQQTSLPLGENINLCVCDTKIIGADCWNGQWQLWFWFPLQGGERFIIPTWTSDADRVTVLAIDRMAQEKQHHFWCIEEYSVGVRVSLFSGETLQPVEQTWINEVRLPYRMGRRSTSLVACGLMAIEDTLLVATIDRARKIHILILK